MVDADVIVLLSSLNGKQRRCFTNTDCFVQPTLSCVCKGHNVGPLVALFVESILRFQSRPPAGCLDDGGDGGEAFGRRPDPTVLP